MNTVLVEVTIITKQLCFIIVPDLVLSAIIFNNFFYLYYQSMHFNSAPNLRQILRQPQISLQSIETCLRDLQSEHEIERIFGFVAQLAKNLAKDQQVYVRVNAVSVAFRFLTLANYPSLLFAEIYLMPHIQKAIDFFTSKTAGQQLTHFFENEGYSSSILNIKNLSYNFVSICCNFVQLAAAIKPLKVYQGREYSESSNFQKSNQKLQKKYEKQQNKQAQRLRQSYLFSLSKWSQYQDLLVEFFVRMVEQYLREGSEQKRYGLSFYDILKYGQPSITSQTLARLIEIVSSSYNFRIRTRALKIIDSLILWGDIEALLVVNFTEHIQVVVQNLLYIKGQISIDQGAKIYLEIQGQQQQKLEFYIFFLKCLQTWAECYPKNDSFYSENNSTNKQSVIYKLYKVLSQNKRFKFPQNLLIARYQKESHANFKAKTIRNQIILQDINGQSQSESTIKGQPKTFEQVQIFYEQNKETLLAVLSNEANQLNENMNKMLHFKQNFQNYVQSISELSGFSQNIDLLIENGLELIDLIQAVHLPYVQYLKRNCNFSEFKEIIAKVCFRYFHCDGCSQSQRPFRRFLSQKLKIKKMELSSMKAKSIPLQNDLKMIANNLDIKQLRAKYKKKMEKSQNNRNSEGSMLNLQIHTRTRWSKHSSDKNQNQQNDQSSENSLKRKVQQQYTKFEPLSSKNERINESKGSNKKLNVTSKQLSNKRDITIKKSRENNPPEAINEPRNMASEKNRQPQLQTQETNIKAQIKNEIGKFIYNIRLSQNEEYYSYLRNENFKYSYTLGHIIIFRSQQLVVQRMICQVFEENKIKVKIYIILIPSTQLPKFSYYVSDQGAIKLADRSRPFPQNLVPQARFMIQIVGEMNKIPLKLPTIALFSNNQPILQYVLPFTINFFLDCHSNETQVLSSFRFIQSTLHYQFVSEKFQSSQILFPHEKSDNIFIYFPFVLKLSKKGEAKELFLWEVKYNNSKFLIVMEYYLAQRQIVVKLQAPIASDDSLIPFYKYIVNWLVYLLGRFKLPSQ